MPLIQSMIEEMEQEGATTRRLLQRLPQEHLGWKPHAKARPLGELAIHIATVQPALAGMLQSASADAASTQRDSQPQTVDEIVAAFDQGLASAKSLLAQLSDDDLHSTWSLLREGKPVFTMPKIAVVRTVILNHVYHHRGQLSTYLRMLDVVLPSIYGPTADERGF
jgi:uncharacterized damage-inducible protein DinB